MISSFSDQVTTQFYRWEQRGRGWLWCDLPVDIEPPFHPFFFHSAKPVIHIDEGYKPTILSRVADLFRGPRHLPYIEDDATFDEPEIEPYLFDCEEDIVVLSLSLPKGHKVHIEETEQLLLMLSGCRYPISFEILGSQSSIVLQFACRQSDKSRVESQVKAFFPQCILKERTDLIDEITKTAVYASVLDFGLRDEFTRPVAMADSFDVDPFIGIFAAFDHLKEGEHGIIQILFKGTINPWAESILRSVTDSDGKAFFEDAPEMLPLAREKVAAPLFGVTMKVMGVGHTEKSARAVQEEIGSAFVRIFRSPSNTLIPLNADIEFQEAVDDIILRSSHRLGMLLNSKELATIVHLPSQSVTSSKLERDSRKTKAAPSITEGHKFILGTNEHQGVEKKVGISSSQKLKHTHIIGATGTGKSTLLQSIIVQDIQNGNGLAVLDPHGDLIESLLEYIPEERLQDVILIDPADAEYPVGFNILSAHSEVEKDILSSDLVAVFKRLSTSWGDQMNSVFANAILAFLESNQGGTLVDLRRFLIEKSFREKYLKTVSDPSIVYYWQKEFPLIKSGSIGPILTRLDTFLRPKLIRNMVAQKKGLDFEDILDSGKILLVKLSQGLIGAENSYLLGTFFVSKMYQAAMARQAKSKEARNDFFLYIDEFQNFITPSMSHILSGARKYHLGLILAHQDMAQLSKYDSELASSVVANAGTRICFRLGDTDAKRFESGFSIFEREDLENLHTGEAIARIERPEFDFSLITVPIQAPHTAIAEYRKNAAIEQSRQKYGTPKQEVELLFQSLNEELVAEIRKEEPKGGSTRSEETNNETLPTADIPSFHPSEELDSTAKENLVRQNEVKQHRYLQTLIKKMAESRGYRATLEEPTPDGNGRVDVSLERNGKKIACEVTVTTKDTWEVHNIEKCLAAGYDLVITCSTEKRTIENIRQKVEHALDNSLKEKVRILEPEQLFLLLDEEVAKDVSTEKRIKGYRVQVEYNTVSNTEMNRKRESVGSEVLKSAKRKK